MWVKICANTTVEDAALAASLGADAVGFVFAPSKRQVNAAQVAAITPHLPETVEKVGVFDTHDFAGIAATVAEAGLTAVQLHGDLDETLAERLASAFHGTIGIIQTVHWKLAAPEATEVTFAHVAAELASIARWGTVDRVLIDTQTVSASGGTGVQFDWLEAQQVFASPPPSLRLIVAGGLRPENVAEAIRTLKPWGVDVASGVEFGPGRKNPQRMADFIRRSKE